MEAFSRAAAYIAAVFLVANYSKALPGAYHARCVMGFLAALFATPLTAPSEPVRSLHHRVLLGDLDFNCHMNNSCYALEIDIARFSWFLHFLRRLPGPALRSWMWGGRGVKIANGGVTMVFHKELTLGQGYEIVTHLRSADSKWLYLQSNVVSRGIVHASTVARVVFKAGGGQTIPPAVVLEKLGYGGPSTWTQAADGGFSVGDGGPIGLGVTHTAAALAARCHGGFLPQPSNRR
jgi:acyl-CoA thioesterase FadM